MIKLKVSWKQLYIMCVFLWSLLFTMATETSIPIPYIVYTVSWYAIRMILVLKITIYDHCKMKKNLISMVLILVGMLSAHYSESEFLVAFFWFLAAADEIEIRDIVKALFYAQLIIFICTVVLGTAGFIETKDFIRPQTGVIRHSAGFVHPNSFAQKAFQISAMYIYLVGIRVAIKHILLTLLFNYVIYRYTDSNTLWQLTIIMEAFLILYLISRGKDSLLSNISTWIIRTMKYSCVIIAGVSFWLTLNYQDNDVLPGIASTSTLASRFTQMYLYFKTYKIKLFGQLLYYHGNSSASSVNYSGLYTLDNAFVYLILGFGIVVSAIIAILYIGSILKAVKEHEYIILLLFVVYLIYGFTETALIRFSYNFTLVFTFAFVWKENFSKRYALEVKNEEVLDEKTDS